jgi:hypothetical protein
MRRLAITDDKRLVHSATTCDRRPGIKPRVITLCEHKLGPTKWTETPNAVFSCIFCIAKLRAELKLAA